MASLRNAVAAVLLLVCTAVSVRADGYSFEVIAADLSRPTGIAVSARGDVYFTEIPTPGVPGSLGGMNRVAVRDVRTGAISTLSFGEPEPLNLALSKQGDLYWTCKSAGVILALPKGATMPALVLSGLPKPSGIAVDNNGRDRGTLYFTEVPTPGVPGGANGVFEYDGSSISTLSMGEPEPVDVAVDHKGNLYWTCRTAGVILTLQRGASAPTLFLSGLNAPTGIAVDKSFLYFTEVPQPGVAGGDNKVWKYDLKRGGLSLIHAGDPEPTDVAVGPDGSVYWTCTSAGVIVKATRNGGRR
jgi:hypothetical protein